jgi:hypothetical protein
MEQKMTPTQKTKNEIPERDRHILLRLNELNRYLGEDYKLALIGTNIKDEEAHFCFSQLGDQRIRKTMDKLNKDGVVQAEGKIPPHLNQ